MIQLVLITEAHSEPHGLVERNSLQPRRFLDPLPFSSIHRIKLFFRHPLVFSKEQHTDDYVVNVSRQYYYEARQVEKKHIPKLRALASASPQIPITIDW